MLSGMIKLTLRTNIFLSLMLMLYTFDGRLLRGPEDQRPGKKFSSIYFIKAFRHTMSGGAFRHTMSGGLINRADFNSYYSLHACILF